MNKGFQRTLVVAAAAAVTAMAWVPSVSGAAAKAHKAAVITFWSWVPGIGKAVALFNSTHPNIHVEWTDVGTGQTQYTKLFAAIKAHNPPDVAQVEYEYLPDFESTGALLNLARFIPGWLPGKFLSWTWKQVKLGNAVYAIPQDSGPEVLYYRADIFKKYKIPVPTTWAGYAADAQKLHAADPSAYITDFPPADPSWLLGMMWENGARWFHAKAGTWHVSINDPSSLYVAAYWQRLLGQGLVKTDPDFATAWYHDLADGSVATWVSAAWGWAIIKDEAPKTSGDWRVAPLPQWKPGAHSGGNWGGSTDVVFNSTKHPHAAATFVNWLNTDLASWKLLISLGGLYPAYKPAFTLPELSSAVPFFGNQHLGTDFASAARQVNTRFRWGPTMSAVYTTASDLFAKVIHHQLTLMRTLNQLQAETVRSMRQQGYRVVSSR